MRYKKNFFTIIELLLSVSIIAMLTATLMPSLTESRQRARFVRWLQFNKQCSNDTSCVVNLNFQDGAGDIIKNSAIGYEAEGYSAKGYDGVIQGDYQWTSGRWTSNKRALQFDGESTFFEILDSEHVNFSGKSGFTFIVSLQFDTLSKFDGIFGKCYMRNSVNGTPQYVVYYDNTQFGSQNSTKLFHMDIGDVSATFENLDQNGNEVKIDNGWVHFVLRHEVTAEGQLIDVFINGAKLKGTCRNLGSGSEVVEEANLAIGCIRWLVLSNRDKHDPAQYGKPDNFIKGRMDELLIYNRALSNAEIMAHYEMGADRHY